VTDRNKLLYWQSMGAASQRGIPFLLSYKQWLKIWTDSGHLHERGRHCNQYQMARFGDKGAYEVGNVKICTAKENRQEQEYTPEHREKLRKANLGKKASPQARRNMSKAHKGKPSSFEGKHHTKESKEKMRLARLGKPSSYGMLGKKHKEETKRKISESITRTLAKKREKV